MNATRVGEGWDLHRLVRGRRLMLGGVEVPSALGELAHSDGDVLLHAVCDALLGASASGDIGALFPPEDERWRDADSRELLAEALALVRSKGFAPLNLDCTVILERPKLRPHIDVIRASLAAILGLEASRVSVKAKTAEGLGPIGAGEAIEARAVVLMGTSA